MRGNRTLVVVAVVLILLVIVIGAGYLYLQQQAGTGGEPTPEETATYVPTDYTDIVVAVQSIPRGTVISVEQKAIELQPWPNDYLPVEYYTSLEEVDGRFARMDIPRGSPVYPDMVGHPGEMLSASGSAASLFAPETRVAYAIPMDTQGAVAWALQPGDHVDVIAATKLLPVDPEFQSKLPNLFFALPRSEEESALSGVYGRFETLPNGQSALIYPSGEMYPSLVVQLTVQDAIVWHIGIWEEGEEAGQAAATATPEPAAGGGGGLLGPAEVAATPIPTPATRKDIEPITLLVTREDALVLKYLYEMGADLDLVLRPAGYTDIVIQTQPVWQPYVVDKYLLPDKMPELPVAPTAVSTPLVVPTLATPQAEQ